MMTQAARRTLPWLLGSHGVCMTAAGLALLVSPAWANRVEAGVSSIFVEHLAQSRGASVLALGLVALLAAKRGDAFRWMLPALAIGNAVLAGLFLMLQFSPMASPARWIAVLACIVWTAGFAWQAPGSTAGPASSVGSKIDPLRVLTITFALWTGITGLLWIVTPGAFGSGLEAMAGPGAGYFAIARGAVDLPLGWLVWSARDRLRLPAALPVAIGMLVANVALSIAGLIAQLKSIANPARWAVELLHVAWMIGAAILVWQLLKASAKQR
jgi:hypothetical protein